MTSRIFLLIGLGGFIGTITRYVTVSWLTKLFPATFFYGTFAVNTIGCFLIGLVWGISERGNLTPEWRLFFATGLIGGFTTFSAFSNETASLLRDGQFGQALAYMGASVIIGLVATFAGVSIIKLI